MKTVMYKLSRNSKITIAFIADFHDRDPNPVIETVQSVSPDMIMIAGDTLERHDPEISPYTYKEMNDWQGLSTSSRKIGQFLKHLNLLTGKATGSKEHIKVDGKNENGLILLRALSQIAPVFMSVGNHEWYFEDRDYRLLQECGITLLDNADMVWKEMRIGGLSTRYNLEWLKEFSKKDGYKILLCHHPEYYERYVKDIDTFDLILSGHAHGGQWRIRKHGIYGSGQGFFPKYCYGEYRTKVGKMIVTSGASVTSNIPRIGNPCEVVVLASE